MLPSELYRPLFETGEGDVDPDVAVEVEQNGVEARQCVEQLGHVVVRLDLNGEGILHEAQLALDNSLGERGPVDGRIGAEVRVVIADRAVELAADFQCLENVERAAQAADEYGEFLADGGWRRSLSVRAGQQRNSFPRLRLGGQVVDEFLLLDHQNFATLLEHERVGNIVDVFGGAGEVQEFAEFFERGSGDFFLQVIFDRLNVVVRGFLNVFDLLGLFRRESVDNSIELRGFVVGERTALGNAGLSAERFQPQHFDPHAAADECVFGKGILQNSNLGFVTPVERT
jgi:hypothetical protein